jgi:beta-lactamase regulating signal transducer with metallopeptidase domain
MSAVLSLDNLMSWLLQIAVIAVVGALLPTLFRIRHPKSQLLYYHALLVLCFTLPVIQPWQRPLLIVSGFVADSGRAPAASPLSLFNAVLWIVVVGIAVKLCWLGVGLWQLRRYRRSAVPLCPLPESIRDARKYTLADALFCVSEDVDGPATLGYRNPVVLVPRSFLALDEDAQRSIACHELLHVRRNDWLVTIVEEVAGAVFWFHPAVGWLLAKAKLTREQLVDAEVVRMTAPAPYIEALLSMAVVSKGRLALPAAPFFTEGHLAHRMRALLSNPRRSWWRLSISYVSAVCFLGVTAWVVLVFFPLNGEAQVVMSARPNDFNVLVTAPPITQRDVIYFENFEASGRFSGIVGGCPGCDAGLLPPPPPPPPPPPMPGPSIRSERGIRILRPGQFASPEDIQSFIASLPERSLVEVTQAEDGTIQRVMVQSRRLSDAKTSIPIGAGTFFHVAGPDPADSANGVD